MLKKNVRFSNFCNKKLSIIERDMPKCKCGFNFCNQHRFFNKHNCNFNYLDHNKQKLSNLNPKIINKSLEIF